MGVPILSVTGTAIGIACGTPFNQIRLSAIGCILLLGGLIVEINFIPVPFTSMLGMALLLLLTSGMSFIGSIPYIVFYCEGRSRTHKSRQEH